MTLWLDGDSTIDPSICYDCGVEHLLVKSFILDTEGPHSIAFTALHHHGENEAWMDVIFGSFEGDARRDDRITFGCRVGPVEGGGAPAATAVQAAIPYADSPSFGHKLSRDEALAHPRLSDFWQVVDFLLEQEPTINHHMYGHIDAPDPKQRRWWRGSR